MTANPGSGYNDGMVLLLTGTALGLMALVSAIIVQLRARGWFFFAGLSRMRAERRARVDAVRLSRRLSVVLYAFAAGLLAGALLGAIKVISDEFLMVAYFALSLVVYDLAWIAQRSCDRNEYPPAHLRRGKAALAAVNAAFLFMILAFAR